MARKPARLPDDGTRLSDHVTLGVLTAAVPAASIDAVLADTGRQSRRQRQPPARVMVYYVIALALYARASYGEVLRRLLEGLRRLRLAGTDPDPAGKSAITVLDPAEAPAAELAALYHERWESEGAFAELKVSLPGERLMLRSRRADPVGQELYGLLLTHFALRRLMHEASRRAGCDPDTPSFIHAVRVVRRHLPFHAASSPAPAPPHA